MFIHTGYGTVFINYKKKRLNPALKKIMDNDIHSNQISKTSCNWFQYTDNHHTKFDGALNEHIAQPRKVSDIKIQERTRCVRYVYF